MDKVKFSVLSCCISRDVLDFDAKTYGFGSDKYIIERFVQFISPYTMLDGKPIGLTADVLIDCKISDFRKRNICLDANKKAIDYLAEVHSDWLLLDFGEVRGGIVEWPQSNFVLTTNKLTQLCIKAICEFINDDNYNIYSFNKLSASELKKRMAAVFEKLSALYKSEQMILTQIYGADFYISKDGELKEFGTGSIESFNISDKIIHEFEVLFKERFKCCHVIPAPNNILSDEKHRWGTHPLHYNNLYYEYAEKCVDIITQKLERSEEERQIEYLRQLYSEKFAALREKAAHKSTSLDRDKWRTYSDTFKQLINSNQLEYGEDTIKNIERAFLAKGHRRVAIYGDTEISKVLCNVLGGGYKRFYKIYRRGQQKAC